MVAFDYPHALPYHGGKNAQAPHGTGRWIRSILPYRETYIEPFAGMLGVLLQRKVSEYEYANDLDWRIYNWWNIVQNQFDDFYYQAMHTPGGRLEAEWARNVVDDDTRSDMERALAYTTILSTCIPSTYNWGLNPTFYNYKTTTSRLTLVNERVRDVKFTNVDAIEVLDKVYPVDTVIYCDPPYRNSEPYRHDVDRIVMMDVLRKQGCLVAISGYGNEWDELGWHRVERRTFSTMDAFASKGGERIEVLWSNFVIDTQGTLRS